MSYALTRETLEDLRTALAVARGAASRADDATTAATLEGLLAELRRVDGLETSALAEFAGLAESVAADHWPHPSADAAGVRRALARASRLAELAKGVRFALGVGEP